MDESSQDARSLSNSASPICHHGKVWRSHFTSVGASGGAALSCPGARSNSDNPTSIATPARPATDRRRRTTRREIGAGLCVQARHACHALSFEGNGPGGNCGTPGPAAGLEVLNFSRPPHRSTPERRRRASPLSQYAAAPLCSFLPTGRLGPRWIRLEEPATDHKRVQSELSRAPHHPHHSSVLPRHGRAKPSLTSISPAVARPIRNRASTRP